MVDMPINLETFRTVANSAFFTSRDIAISGKGTQASARLGNYVFSAGKSANVAVMKAFKEALEKEYGTLGTHAFDTIVGARAQMKKSLRACDVKAVLSNIPQIRHNRLVGEINRQLDINPKMLQLTKEENEAVRAEIAANPEAGLNMESLKTMQDISRAAAKRIEQAISKAADGAEGIGHKDLGMATVDQENVDPKDPVGLKQLKTIFKKGSTSVEDQIKKGKLGTGMRVNRSSTNPVLLESLKSNGVEPGFIYRNDWSQNDTRGFMADINSEASRHALDVLKEQNPEFAKQCEGKSLRAQIMLAGRAHPAVMAAVAEFVIEEAISALRDEQSLRNHPFKDLAQAMKFRIGEHNLQRLAGHVSDARNAELLKEVKLELFNEIRDAVMGVKEGSDFYTFSPVFKHFTERHILKLDYNEQDRWKTGATSHKGTFMRPERILASRKPILGQIYRIQTAASADSISAGAVTEALANDLTRLAGIPSQELTIARGQYSDGHPKLMLEAKFAKGYKDMEAGYIKDGRIVRPPDAPKDLTLEGLGKYKAFFLLTADRDGVGKRGQNKGFVDGKFFAIDPGHSLEGNGKYLEVADDFSFKDTYGKSTKPRFNNFSIFDDDTRFAKLEGLVKLREIAQSGAFDRLFDDYLTTFSPDEEGISDAEKTLRLKIKEEIKQKRTEFDQSLKKLLNVGGKQLELYDDLAEDGPEMQEKAINTLSHLEMLTSPTTWVSKKGQVALNHLEVKQETRVPWNAYAEGDNMVYFCDKPLDYSTMKLVESVAKSAGVHYEFDNYGNSRIVVPKADAEKFFAAFSEENVQKLTHPEEYAARKMGGDPLAVAKDYSPKPFVHTPDPRPPMKADELPPSLDVRLPTGKIVKLPKLHYETMATKTSKYSRPRNEGELRASLESRIRRGYEIMNALLTGKTMRFDATEDNIAAFTLALHTAALSKGELMYRGSFSIQDPQGTIARWLDSNPDIYLRTSTHAKPYQNLQVDGHLNMPRGFDVKEGIGGMFNGMRTFHYFSLPDQNHMNDVERGSGPRRRLFFKCETYGIYWSTAHVHFINKKQARSDGMHIRYPRFGDVCESIAHGASLFRSYFTSKTASGIRKENLPPTVKMALSNAEIALRENGFVDMANKLDFKTVFDGGGVLRLLDNLQVALRQMSEEDALRAAGILMPFIDQVDEALMPLGGDIHMRMGNEIMIDAKDFGIQ